MTLVVARRPARECGRCIRRDHAAAWAAEQAAKRRIHGFSVTDAARLPPVGSVNLPCGVNQTRRSRVSYTLREEGRTVRDPSMVARQQSWVAIASSVPRVSCNAVA